MPFGHSRKFKTRPRGRLLSLLFLILLKKELHTTSRRRNRPAAAPPSTLRAAAATVDRRPSTADPHRTAPHRTASPCRDARVPLAHHSRVTRASRTHAHTPLTTTTTMTRRDDDTAATSRAAVAAVDRARANTRFLTSIVASRCRCRRCCRRRCRCRTLRSCLRGLKTTGAGVVSSINY